MKPIFRCEYCTEQGTKEELEKHEAECIFNYNKRSCLTCQHAGGPVLKTVCARGIDLAEGKYYENCHWYEWDGKDHTAVKNIFGGNIFNSFFK